MASDTHVIDVPGLDEPWPLVMEIARVTPAGSWVLVGGLMVQAHALRSNVTATRTTRDVDMVINVAAASVGEVAGPLLTIGFQAIEPQLSTHIHRFERGQDIVDVMVPSSGRRLRWRRFPIFVAPAAAQAIERCDRYEFRGSQQAETILVPDELGAIISKGAAYKADTRDRGRHLEDLTTLLAAAENTQSLDLSRLTSSDRRHIRPAFLLLSERNHEAWGTLDSLDRSIAQRTAAALLNHLRLEMH